MKSRSPLSGADAFLLAVERMMLRAGQGQHLGLTVLQLGPGVDVPRLRAAIERVDKGSPIAAARLRHGFLRIPRWEWNGTTQAHFPFHEHPSGTDVDALSHSLLNEAREEAVRFDLVPGPDGSTLITSWRHRLLDGKGAELLLAEVARVADAETSEPHEGSWGAAQSRNLKWREFLGEAERFKNQFYSNAQLPIRSLAGPTPLRARARFVLEHFTTEETARIGERAREITRGMFMLAWFMAVAMRAHRAVFLQRGQEPESYQASCAVQERKRGARHPIWQNQVSQLFFCLTPDKAAELPTAARELHSQFESLTRGRMERAFAAMTGLFRRMPTSWYLQFVRGNSGGHVTSFFYSHTGQFLPECERIAGAPILNGWHVPSVSAPPGSGIFFSERNGQLTATIAWRDPGVTDDEVAMIRKTLREELLGR
ncbi:MAG: hypothetical protein ACO1QR_15645 [Chthoniobacteraceae bacterium]